MKGHPRTLRDLNICSEAAAVAAAIQVNQFHLFSAPIKFVTSNPNHVYFHSIGGRCRRNELFPDALSREVREEIGKELILSSCTRTRIVTTEGYRTDLVLEDHPTPFWILQKTLDNDVSFRHRNIHWLIGYRAELHEEMLYPLRELALLLLLTDEMLANSFGNQLTFSEIAGSRDGSRIILRNDVQLDYQKVAVPVGLARILGSESSSNSMSASVGNK